MGRSGQLIHVRSVQWAYKRANGSLVEDQSSFQPVLDLDRPAADISLIFLSANEIRFAGQSNDPWYSAHVPSSLTSMRKWGLQGDVSLYTRDDPVRVLGCTSQYQYCNPNLEPDKRCTPLSGILEVDLLAHDLWDNDRQRALFNWTASAILQNSMAFNDVITDLGVTALTARTKMSANLQGPLPDNQWQLEVEHWFTSALADLQRMAIELATGPFDQKLTPFLQRPQIAEEQLLCRSQVNLVPRMFRVSAR